MKSGAHAAPIIADRALSSMDDSRSFLSAWGGWALMIFPLLFNPCARWFFPWSAYVPSLPVTLVCFAFGAFLVFRSFRELKTDDTFEWSRSWAWAAMAFIVAATFFLRMTRFDVPIGNFDSDPAIELERTRQILDYGSRPLVMDWCRYGAFILYYLGFFWKIFPDLSGIHILRVSGVAADLAAVVLFYFIGKELKGRGLGVLLASLGAVSRLMLDKTYMYVDCFTLMLAAAILSQWRLFHKPSLWRFIQWGLVLGIGFYGYPAYRPWPIFLFLVTAGWLFLRPELRKERPLFAGLLGWWCALALLLFFWGNRVMLPSAALMHGVALGLALVSALVLGAAFFLSKIPGKAGAWLTLGLAVALFELTALFYPLTQNDVFYVRMNEVVDVKPLETLSGLWGFVEGRVELLWTTLFSTGWDYFIEGPVYETFFDFYSLACVILGLVYLAARPDWMKGFFFLCLLPGLFPWLVISGPHSNRMVGILIPLYTLGALALERLLAWAWKIKFQGFNWRNAFAAFLVLFWAWAAWANLRAVWNWMDDHSPDLLIGNPAARESLVNRTYEDTTTPTTYFDMRSQDVLFEGKNVYQLNQENPIRLAAGEKKPNISIFFFGDGNKTLLERVKQEFPGAQWTPMFEKPRSGIYSDYPSNKALVSKISIPAEEIPSQPGKVFYFQEAQSGEWTRKFYDAQYGRRLGVILVEDNVLDLHAPLRPEVPDISSSLCTRDFDAPAPGDYRFSADSGNIAALSVDGKSVFVRDPFRTNLEVHGTVSLTAGPHKIAYWTFFAYGKTIPPLHVQGPVGPEATW